MNEVSAKPEKKRKKEKKRWLYIEPFKPVESELKQKKPPPNEAVCCLHHSLPGFLHNQPVRFGFPPT